MATPKTLARLTDLTPDPANANRGIARGRALLERSLERLGAGRSIVVDRNGVIIAGNKTFEEAGALGFELEVVKSDGRKLIVVQREDLDMAAVEDARARELAVADNRVSEVSLDWDPNVLLHHMPGVVLTDYFFDEELARIWDTAYAKGELAQPADVTTEPTTAAAAERTVDPEPGSTPAHDPADEDQSHECPSCGHTW